MKRLPIADDLSLPLEVITDAMGMIGRRGSGKTYAAQRLAELMYRAEAQFIALDPVGNWWALRLDADGKNASPFQTPVFGGLKGDVPLEPTAGKLIADVIVDRGISAIVDISQFESNAAKSRFATDFGERLFYRKKAAPSALHIFMEEAQELVPQNPQSDENRMLGAWQRIAKLGRNYGIGFSLLSQRPQEVHKKVLNLVEVLFVFQLSGTHERKAVTAWIEDKGIDEDIDAILPKLKRGEPHVWSPVMLAISRVVRISKKETFDASATPTVGKRADIRELAPIDLEHLGKEIAASKERADATDPKKLVARIRELEAKLAKPAAPDPNSLKFTEQVTAAVNGAMENFRKRMYESGQRMAATYNAALERMREGMVERATNALRAVELPRLTDRDIAAATDIKLPPARDVAISLGGRVIAESGRRSGKTAAAERARTFSGDKGESSGLGKGERRTLTVVAQHPSGVTPEQITVMTAYKRSSRNAYIQRLVARQLVTRQSGGVRVSDMLFNEGEK